MSAMNVGNSEMISLKIIATISLSIYLYHKKLFCNNDSNFILNYLMRYKIKLHANKIT